MFSPKFVSKLDPIYRQELEKLEICSPKSDKATFNLLNEFSSNFLMPKKLWDKKIKLIQSLTLGNYYVYKMGVAAECIFHLCYLTIPDRKYLHVPYLHDKKLYYCEDRDLQSFYETELIIESICFPHKNLEMKWRDLEFSSTSIIPRSDYRRFEKMKKLFIKIKLIRNNTEKWFNALLEAEDYEFVVDNVEYRLNLNLANKKLWKLYIQFLKTNNNKKLLETYSKYCRFFLEDSEMLEEYRKTSEKYGPSIVLWKNTFEFEIYDRNCLDFVTPAITSPLPAATKCSTYFDTKNVSPQKFPFHSNLMHYIINSANASVLYDLFKSCKWFYLNYPILICYNFQATKFRNIPEIHQQKIIIIYMSQFKFQNKIFISTGFSFDIYPKDVRAFSKFIPQIYKCTPKYVNISEQYLTYEEMKFLIGHGDVIDLHINIRDQDGKQFKFEDILKLIPKAKHMDIIDTECPSNISQILLDFPFQNKIERLCFGDAKILPDPYIFAQFILKKALSNYACRFSIYGYRNDNREVESNERRTFRRSVEAIVAKKWKWPNFPDLHV